MVTSDIKIKHKSFVFRVMVFNQQTLPSYLVASWITNIYWHCCCTVMKKKLNSDGQIFPKYQQNERKIRLRHMMMEKFHDWKKRIYLYVNYVSLYSRNFTVISKMFWITSSVFR